MIRRVCGLGEEVDHAAKKGPSRVADRTSKLKLSNQRLQLLLSTTCVKFQLVELVQCMIPEQVSVIQSQEGSSSCLVKLFFQGWFRNQAHRTFSV